MAYRILDYDPDLRPYLADIKLRMDNYKRTREALVGRGGLSDFANGYEYFGFHRTESGWVYREWAPAAEAVYLTGDMVEWDKTALALTAIGNGVFEIHLQGRDRLWNGCRVKTVIRHNGALLERIPLYIRRVEQDPVTYVFCGVIADEPYEWKNGGVAPKGDPLIYECHIGMAQEKEGIGSYREFQEKILPRVHALGYNTIQIMAVMEHPYYGSFGYQVSSFYAVCSRYGTPRELKELIDTAHGMGITVLLDVVHSHAVKNTAEGIAEFDGTPYQFFHAGARGEHPAWGTKLFNYGKHEVIHFLLSNLKFYMTEYRFDGFRFDGVTSMLYHDHGLGVNFTDYGKYFSLNTDTEAVTYLQLANELIHEIDPRALTVAEDMSGMPGMCLPIKDGGLGFDYRLAMGEPDLWIRLLKQRDESWSMWEIYGELSGRRPKEKSIGYVESHDQALVGDKTLMFRLCDSAMYTAMSKNDPDITVARGMALHKMIRLITATLGGEGYLTFMGNEFGHPEWIDFPREGNGGSYFYCRRQWHLADDPNLKYGLLETFDRALISLLRKRRMGATPARCLFIDEQKKVIVYERGGCVLAFNFHPTESYDGYFLTLPAEGSYRVTLSTDEERFGGFDRTSMKMTYRAEADDEGIPKCRIYLPSRVGLCLARIGGRKKS